MGSTARKRQERAQNASERLEARVRAEQKMIFRRAAALKGMSLTDFMITTLEAAAQKTVEEHDVLRLSVEDRRAFIDALMKPPAPNQALRRAAERYHRMRER